jgi:hypothetical protein
MTTHVQGVIVVSIGGSNLRQIPQVVSQGNSLANTSHDQVHTSDDQFSYSHFMALSVVMVIHNSRPLPDLAVRYSNFMCRHQTSAGSITISRSLARTVSMAMIRGKWVIENK